MICKYLAAVLPVSAAIAISLCPGVAGADEEVTMGQADFEKALADEDDAVLRAVCEEKTRVTSKRAKAMMERRGRIRAERGGSRDGNQPRRVPTDGSAKRKACRWVSSVDAFRKTTCETVAEDVKAGYPNDRLRLSWASKLIECNELEGLVLQMYGERTWELLGKGADAAIVGYFKKHQGKKFLRSTSRYEIMESLAQFYSKQGGFKHCKLLVDATEASSMNGKSAAFPLFAAGGCRKANPYALDVLTNRTSKATPRNGYSLYTVQVACKMLAVTGTRRELGAVKDAAERHDTRLSKDRNAYTACSSAAREINRR